MSDVRQLAAKMNRDATDGLIRNVLAMPEDKQVWSPLDQGRSALSQIRECAIIAGFSTYTLEHLVLPPDFNEQFGRLTQEIDTVEKAVELLKKNTETMIAGIESFPVENLTKTITMPWQETPISFTEFLFLSYWNTVYHVGQVAYVQTLYGDGAMH